MIKYQILLICSALSFNHVFILYLLMEDIGRSALSLSPSLCPSVPPSLPPFAPVCNFRRVLKSTNTNAEEEISHESAIALLVSRLTLKLGAGNLVLDYVCGRLQVAPGGSSVGCSGAGVTGDCEWVLGTEATSSWLEEQYILLMAEPFLQPTIFQ